MESERTRSTRSLSAATTPCAAPMASACAVCSPWYASPRARRRHTPLMLCHHRRLLRSRLDSARYALSVRRPRTPGACMEGRGRYSARPSTPLAQISRARPVTPTTCSRLARTAPRSPSRLSLGSSAMRRRQRSRRVLVPPSSRCWPLALRAGAACSSPRAVRRAEATWTQWRAESRRRRACSTVRSAFRSRRLARLQSRCCISSQPRVILRMNAGASASAAPTRVCVEATSCGTTLRTSA